jgi:hypothetical protein
MSTVKYIRLGAKDDSEDVPTRTCPKCKGTGIGYANDGEDGEGNIYWDEVDCWCCRGYIKCLKCGYVMVGEQRGSGIR